MSFYALKRLLFTNEYKRFRPLYTGFLITIYALPLNAQYSNHIGNGGFEKLIGCIPSIGLSNASYWNDSVIVGGGLCSYECFNNVPYNGFGFQYPRSGNSYCIADFFAPNSFYTRSYLKNRLKAPLVPNKIYCVKFYVNIGNNSSYGIDGFQAYFGDSSIDTISAASWPLTYLNPQITNLPGNIISDTLNWVAVSGTLSASGNEKYAIFGNFYDANSTGTIVIQPTYSNNVFSTISIDDISCIDIDLPAYAGPDKAVIPGDSVYIGRESDVEIDESCIWYQMTSLTTSITIDTIAGIWVKPVVTSTYVVRQQLWCSGVKWDTVVVRMDAVGFQDLSASYSNFSIFPNPNTGQFTVEANSEIKSLSLEDVSGRLVYDIEFIEPSKNQYFALDLKNGIYVVKTKDRSGGEQCRKLLIAH